MVNTQSESLAFVESFNFVAKADAKVLILGSMPGLISLKEQEYYAHPRNAFWPIMQNLLLGAEEALGLSYEKRLQVLQKHHLALWDVLAKCQRQGSLDSNIDSKSIFLNDFTSLLMYAPDIKTILFNGKAAEKLFKQHVLPKIKDLAGDIDLIAMPSTSPAHAAMSFQDKLKAWSVVKKLTK